MLREFDPGEAARFPPWGEKHDHGRGSAHEHRVDVDAERLHEALLHGVRSVGRGRGVRDRAHAGLVREEPALDARHEGGRKARAEHRVKVEGAANDRHEHFGDHRDVEDRDGEGHQEVGARHEGNHDRHDLGDARDAPADDKCRKRSHRDADPFGREIVAVGGHERKRDRVGLHRIEDEPVGDGEDHGKEGSEEVAPEGVADVVGRAAHEAAALFRGLVDLREGRFNEARGRTDRRDHPHPEDSARAAHHDRDGDPGDVAHAHTRSGRNAEGLEGRDVTLAGGGARAFREKRDHFGETADLHEPRAKGEPQTDADQHDDHDVGPQEVVDDGDELIEPIHGGTPKLRVWRKRKRSRNVRDRAFCFCIGDQGILPSKTQLLEKTVLNHLSLMKNML